MPEALERLLLENRKEMRSVRFLDKDDIALLSNYCEMKDVNSGDVLLREGEPCDFIAFIITGRIQLSKDTELKGNDVVLAEFGPGSTFGELGVLDERPSPVTVLATEATSIMVLDREDFERLIRERPDLGVKVLKGLLLATAVRLAKSYERLIAVF